MGLLLAGALSGFGKGMSEIGAYGMKQAAETKRDQVKFEQGIVAARRSVEIQHELTQKYGAQASSDAQAAMKQTGGDIQKAMQIATNPDAQKLLSEWMDAANNKIKLGNDEIKLADQMATNKASRESSAASRESSAASTEKSRMEIDSAKEIMNARRELADAEAKNINLNGAMQNIVDAKKAKLNTLSGSKPSETWSVRDEYNPDTDERKQITERKGAGEQPKNTVSGVVDYTTFFKK